MSQPEDLIALTSQYNFKNLVDLKVKEVTKL